MKLVIVFALVAALLAACAAAVPQSWVDMPGYRPAIIEIRPSAGLNAACGQAPDWNGNGCAFRSKDSAVILYREGINQAEYERVLEHELVFHIVQGRNHDATKRYVLR